MDYKVKKIFLAIKNYFLLGLTASTAISTVPVTIFTPVDTTSAVMDTAELATEYTAHACKDISITRLMKCFMTSQKDVATK